MAKMVPNWSESDLKLAIPDSRSGAPGERALYQFMKEELPNSWTVVYNTYLEVICRAERRYEVQGYRVRAAPPEMEFRENQFDFLVFVPGKGVVNVDAKGRNYICTGANEVRLGGEMSNPNVFDRAKQAIHTFDAYVKKHYSCGKGWGAFDALVVFVFDDPGVQGVMYGNVSDLVKGSKRLEEKILHILERHNLQHNSSQYYAEYEQALLRDFASVVATSVSYPADYITLENYSRAELSREQRDIHDDIMSNPYVWVQGGAGTGKTILGKKCAEEFAAQGKRVLYVCYNRVLAEYLSRDNPYGERIIYSHFNGLPQALVNEDLTFFKDGRPDWTQTAADIVSILRPKMTKLHVPWFDVVIVDEAQDITKSQLAFLPKIMVPANRHVIIMSDPGQAIYRNNDSWSESDLRARFEGILHETLNRNYRNTDKIYEHYKDTIAIADVVMRPQIASKRVTVEGKPYLTPPVEEVDIPVSTLLEKYFQDETRKYSDIAILACTTSSLKKIPSQVGIGNGKKVRISNRLGDWLDNKVVYKSTVHSFKGLEANCLIIIDDFDQIPLEDQDELSEVIGDVPTEYRRDFLRYVGESRAKFKLIITKKA